MALAALSAALASVREADGERLRLRLDGDRPALARARARSRRMRWASSREMAEKFMACFLDFMRR